MQVINQMVYPKKKKKKVLQDYLQKYLGKNTLFVLTTLLKKVSLHIMKLLKIIKREKNLKEFQQMNQEIYQNHILAITMITTLSIQTFYTNLQNHIKRILMLNKEITIKVPKDLIDKLEFSFHNGLIIAIQPMLQSQ